MEIGFTKKKDENHIISCQRKDGTVTWMRITPFFLMHDICHYATETILSLRHAFYGMLATGTGIADFELPGEQRSFQLGPEAIFAEHLVNLLVLEYTQGGIANFMQILHDSCRKDRESIIPAVFDLAKKDEISNFYSILMTRWITLPEGDTMNLLFIE